MKIHEKLEKEKHFGTAKELLKNENLVKQYLKTEKWTEKDLFGKWMRKKYGVDIYCN